MLYLNTNTLNGFIDDLPLTDAPQEAQVVLLGGKPIDVERFPRVRGLFRAGVGQDNIPWEAAQARNIELGFPSNQTAQIIFTETANFSCQLILRMAYIEIGSLEGWVKLPRQVLSEKTLLVIGTGNIGQLVVERMKPFLTILTYDTLHNTPDELMALLPQADIVTLHIPLNDSTRGFIGIEQLSLLPDGAVIVNTARGPIVNEEALYSEISQGRLRAAFDVFWQEPYSGKLTTFYPDPFYMTPHVASTCQEFLQGTADDLRTFMRRLLS